MPVPFTIKVTKEILAMSKECGIHNRENIGENCAIAHAVKDIFPDVSVTGSHFYPFGIDKKNPIDDLKIELPKIAQDFIKIFDSLTAIHKVRMRLPEFEFEIFIPDKVIAQINIDDAKKLVKENQMHDLVLS
jgi:hypothetical protein